MALSNETAPNLETTKNYLFTLAEMSAKRLASQLIQSARNDEPRDWREAPHPASSTRIRRWAPVLMRPSVDEECKRHNQAVCDLRKPE